MIDNRDRDRDQDRVEHLTPLARGMEAGFIRDEVRATSMAHDHMAHWRAPKSNYGKGVQGHEAGSGSNLWSVRA